MTIDRYRIFHLFKYTVYALLVLNVYLFFAEDWAAASHRFVEGVRPGDIIEGFAQSIDTMVWVLLLLLFELQTSILTDGQTTKRVKVSLHVFRALCYVVIVYAFFGYLAKLLFLFGATPLAGTSDLCSLASDSWAYTVDLDEYVNITAGNCAGFSDAHAFYQLSGVTAVVDRAGLTDIVRLAWVDVINAGVWL
ncbi:MAG: hypothetical protein ACREQ1_15450, partial [Woeseiaceae bacterium]